MAILFDEIQDWTYGTVAAVNEGEKKITLVTGEGALFPAPVNGYYIEVWPAGSLPLLKPSIAEAKQVEAFRIEAGGLTGDVFKWTSRKQLGTPERAIQVGDQVCAPLTAETIKRMEEGINEALSSATALTLSAYGAWTEIERNKEIEPSATEMTTVALTWQYEAEAEWQAEIKVDGKKIGLIFIRDVRAAGEKGFATFLVPKAKKFEIVVTGAPPAGLKFFTSYAGLTGAAGKEGAEGKPGPGPVNWVGEWKAATEYKVNDGVSWKGSSYICIKAMTAGEDKEPPNATFWGVLAEKGEIGSGLKQYSTYHATEVLATGEAKATGALQAGEEDKVTFTVPVGGAAYTIQATAVAKNPGTGYGGAILKIDGSALMVTVSTSNKCGAGSGAFEQFWFNPDVPAAGENVGWRSLGGGSVAGGLGVGVGASIWLAEGSHTVGLYLFNEDRVAGKIKERRLIVSGP